MPTQKSPSGGEANLAKAIRDLEHEVKLVQTRYDHLLQPRKNLLFTYFRGIVYGLGALTAVAIITPIIIALMRQIPWGPIATDFMNDVVERMEQRR